MHNYATLLLQYFRKLLLVEYTVGVPLFLVPIESEEVDRSILWSAVQCQHHPCTAAVHARPPTTCSWLLNLLRAQAEKV